MKKEDFYEFVKNEVAQTDVARFYLGQPYKIKGNSLVYYSPMRVKERTASFFVDDEKGIHDFGTDKHYSVISFVADLFDLSYWEATKKIIKDFRLDISKVERVENTETQIKEVKPKITIVKGNKPKNIVCYFDERKFDTKPKYSYSLGAIKNRIVNNNFYNYKEVEMLIHEILSGKTCIPSAIRGNPKENWTQQQVFMIDFDNKRNGIDITIDNPKHVKERDVIQFCENNMIAPTFVYNTFSHTKQQHKFRLVYVFENPITDMNIAKQIIQILITKLKRFNPDESKKNLADMFFGGINIVYSNSSYYRVEIEK